MDMKIVAGIVLYNPEEERLKENIDAIITQVEGIILVDNGSSNINFVRELSKSQEKITLIENCDNKGIAAALNQIVNKAKEIDCKWVLTLDQDSVCPENIIEEYSKYISKEKVAMISACVVDRNVGVHEEEETDITKVKRCITSATLNKVEALCQVGLFDERLFIDYVDYDMCTRLRMKGYKIIRANKVKLLHEVGKSRKVKFLGRPFVVYNHSPIRKYYYTRNVLYYMKKYRNHIDYKKEKKDFILHTLLVVLYEKNKIKNVKSIFKGFKDYKKLLK